MIQNSKLYQGTRAAIKDEIGYSVLIQTMKRQKRENGALSWRSMRTQHRFIDARSRKPKQDGRWLSRDIKGNIL